MLTELRELITHLKPREQFALAVLLVVDGLLWAAVGIVLVCR